MANSISYDSIINMIVPISRFNKGEANRIFEEVRESDYKIVVKNNNPACILVSPERYGEMVEQIENLTLLLEAESRLRDARSDDFLTEAELLHSLGISEQELGEIGEVAIDG